MRTIPRFRTAFGLAMAVLLLFGPARVGAGEPGAAPILSPRDAEIMQVRLADAPQGLAVIGRLEDDAPRSIQVYPATKTPVNGDTVFEIGSVTKVFTAILLADMLRRGEVHLDDPVEDFLPKGVAAPTFAGHHITLLDLADHHSGLPRMPENARFDPDAIANYTASRMYAAFSSYKLTRVPGSQYEYSNWGGGLLGLLLANRAGTSYADLVRTRIVMPLSLHSTFVPLPHGSSKGLISGYDADGNIQPALTWSGALAGAGAIRSSVNDLLTLGAACLPGANGPIAEDCKIAMIPHSPSGDPQARVALIWEIESKDGIVWHNGDTFGYHGFIGINPSRHAVVAVLSNTSFLTDRVAFHLLDPDRVPEMPASPLPLESDVAQRYAGHYKMQDGTGTVLTVQHIAQGLQLLVPGKGHYRLFATALNTFETHEHATFTFCARADGSIYALVQNTLSNTDVAQRLAQ